MARLRVVLALCVAILALSSCGVLAEAEQKEQHNFGADVAKMLKIIVYSLYQNPEVFVRELISNSADALAKYRMNSLTSGKPVDTPLEVKISADKEKKTLVIRDTGVGMNHTELVDNLGSLGASGTKKFLESIAAGQNANKLIGQFGVGFYSVFLVGENVRVASKSDDSEDQWVWESKADGTFTVYKDPRGNTLERGTEITIDLKADNEQFADVENLKKIARKYSEFIDFPIYIEVCKTEKVPKKKDEAAEEKEDEEKEEKEEEKKEEEEEVTKCEWEHINEQKPIWLRNPSDIEDDEYKAFYKAITKEHDDPLWWSHFSVEGEVEFKSILFIPSRAPYNLFDNTQPLMTNLRLYVRRVFITDEFKDLLPRYLNFIKGVVDSDDLPLNVSREVLQESRLLKVIRRRLSRKALSMLSDVVSKDDEKETEDEEKKRKDEEKTDEEEEKKEEKKDEEKEEKKEKKEKLYPKLWKEFGKSLRLGVIEDSANRNRLTKLLRYVSSKSKGEYSSLEEYVERMHESQKGIFYITGESVEKIEQSPLLERAVSEDVEVLYMTDAIDEYVVGHVTEFSGHKLMNLAKAIQLRDETADEKKVDKRRKEAWTPFLRWVKDILGNKVEKVELSKRLTKTPCILVSPEYGVTPGMERIMKAQALADGGVGMQTAKRILELNPRHSIVDELRRKWKEDASDKTTQDIVKLLYDVAALQSGFELEAVQDFSTRMHRVVKHDLNLDGKEDLVEEEEYPAEEEEDKDEDKEDKEDKDEDKDDRDEL